MRLRDIRPATIEIVRPVTDDIRAITYLATYPSICRLVGGQDPDNDLALHQVALLAYGWMPRVARLDPKYVEGAGSTLTVARKAKNIQDLESESIAQLSLCLRSVVGASKVLHFTNPSVFPIWDSKIESFRSALASKRLSMTLDQYLAYCSEVHAIRLENGFQSFYDEFCAAYARRLAALEIKPYKITAVRAIEAAAFELAGGIPDTDFNN